MAHRVLVADDDRAIRESLQRALELDGYVVDTTADGVETLSVLRGGEYDLAVLDVMMPGVDGLGVCKVLRADGSDMPVLMLTARVETSDRVAGLDAGADDYLPKPFELDELLARLRALLRRSRPQPVGSAPAASLQLGGLRVDAAARRAWWRSAELTLSKTEFDLLELLARNDGIVLTHATIYDRIWGYDFGPDSKNLAVYIGYLRRKLDDAGAPSMIRTVRGVGYSLSPGDGVSLRRMFIVAFAGVAAVVAALVGALSYDVTATNLRVEIDQSLAAAVATVQSGGSLPPPGTPGGGDGPGGGPRDRDGPGRSLNIVTAAQRVAPDGTVTVLLGDALPVDRDSQALAAGDRAGQTRYRTQAIGPGTFRVLTQSTGSGAVMAARSLDVTNDVLADLALEITASGVGVLAVAAAAGWLIARRITRRLLLLTEAAEQVSATGRLDTPMGTPGRDEVGRLGTALDTMLAELARSREDQQRLVQNAGHELRTPLTSLRTNVSVLRRSAELSADGRRRLLDDLDGETRELTTLVNELVELASDRRATEQPTPVDLADLAEATAQRFRRRTGREITVDAADAVVVGRPQALERALSNLLDNAIKFDPGGREPVQVRVGPDRIEVLDRGPGIDPADTGHVFERFYRATSARSVTGSGLGLAIVREIAELHGGTVFVTARPGGGTAIGLTLHPEGAADRPML